MWPLSFFLLFATIAPQQTSPDATAKTQPKQSLPQRFLANDAQRDNVCYTMRTYFFRRQNGHAPIPAGMTTCTPGNLLQQRQVTPGPKVLFVPLSTQPADEQP
jgi:hypothetical protein